MPPVWRHDYRNTRCPMPAEGWYEWQQVERVEPATGEILKVKQPHFIHRPDEPFFAFASLMSRWIKADGESALSCAMLTKAAAPGLADVHDRMPVVLAPEQYEEWINPALTDADDVARMIDDAQKDFEHYPVSTRSTA